MLSAIAGARLDNHCPPLANSAASRTCRLGFRIQGDTRRVVCNSPNISSYSGRGANTLSRSLKTSSTPPCLITSGVIIPPPAPSALDFFAKNRMPFGTAVKVKRWGFPAAHRTVTTFRPCSNPPTDDSGIYACWSGKLAKRAGVETRPCERLQFPSTKFSCCFEPTSTTAIYLYGSSSRL